MNKDHQDSLGPLFRPRRLRENRILREMVRETALGAADLVYPLFAVEGRGWKKEEIPSMPGICRHSVDSLLTEIDGALEDGVKAFIFFGIPSRKDERASQAYAGRGVVQQAVRAAKKRFGEDALLITDVCLCEYTSHGHCGVTGGKGEISNDASLPLLAETAISHAEAGADMVAPSDMMDGRVGAIRDALDHCGYTSVPIMAYSAKYCSKFYGPFREAAGSAPQFGDRRSYQMDPCNAVEALKEIALDIDEGADIVMVKPALVYLDIVKKAYESFDVPIAAYNVSGEYSMIKAAAKMGWLDEEGTMMETLTSIKRAGASIILTYFARQAARLLKP
ncbi:MAG TPA: porphobilinogen synthase [Acidobacteriota bacterium]|nr:porphobilinogen synthase [Acidobacteriota bacterium]HQO20028.1 porphobilinogen synthase [Acidobacteriota bacterium]HQQ45821.1 porphobilinogen synthase [Acidobacteriota bacterium]